jgi:hypothetical protein
MTLRRIDPGQTFVWGRSAEMARALLDAADQVGVDQMEVRTVGNGYLVPDAVWDRVAQPDPPPPGGEF